MIFRCFFYLLKTGFNYLNFNLDPYPFFLLVFLFGVFFFSFSFYKSTKKFDFFLRAIFIISFWILVHSTWFLFMEGSDMLYREGLITNFFRSKFDKIFKIWEDYINQYGFNPNNTPPPNSNDLDYILSLLNDDRKDIDPQTLSEISNPRYY